MRKNSVPTSTYQSLFENCPGSGLGGKGKQTMQSIRCKFWQPPYFQKWQENSEILKTSKKTRHLLMAGVCIFSRFNYEE